MPAVYDQLRRLARRYMKGERSEHLLQPTALVHEAYIRLQALHSVRWQSREHFFAMAARQMRRVLVEHARAAQAQKRGVDYQRVVFEDDLPAAAAVSIDKLLALDEALRILNTRHPRRSQIVEMRLFGGMSVPEVSHHLGVSERTVKHDWQQARVWLSTQLTCCRDH
jgi:RNA polymerase sigma factor (TIGR02999 family)